MIQDASQTGFKPMRKYLLDYAIPLAAVAIGILSGVMPPTSIVVLWSASGGGALLVIWLLVYAYGLKRAGLYIAIAFAFSFCAEHALVNLTGYLTHFAHPQLAGIAVLA